jgi:ABC-type cobalamin/Fe3+-siderophores transport system ATPase subunit
VNAASKALLEARAIEFAYPQGPPVIRGVSLGVPAGKLCAVIGSNGCGKSTLVRMFAGLLTPAKGEILLSEPRPLGSGRLDSVALASIPKRELAKLLAYVPQANPLAFPFTALEVVLTGRSPYTPRFRFEDQRDREQAIQALETVNAGHLAARRVTELSGGERQMVSVARALAQNPRCLLLDEPSAALDLKHRAALVRTLAAMRDAQGLTALVITHDLQLIDPAFDCVFALRRGELAAAGSPAEVLTDGVLAAIYDDPYVRTRRVDGRTLIWSN